MAALIDTPGVLHAVLGRRRVREGDERAPGALDQALPLQSFSPMDPSLQWAERLWQAAQAHLPRAAEDAGNASIERPSVFGAAAAGQAVADQAYPEQVRNLVELWLFGGPRTSEIQGLKWPSVGLARGEVEIHEAPVRGRAKDRTKTAMAQTVRLTRRALAAIKRQKKHTLLAGEHVFRDPRHGEPWHEERAFRRRDWTPVLKQLGIRCRRPCQTRHTYASMLPMPGAKPGRCAKQMGDSVEIFHSTCSKWIDGQRDEHELGLVEQFLAASAARDGAPELPPKTAGAL